jgi:hypothetical protein
VAGGELAFAYRVERRDGYVLVWQCGTVTTREQLERMQADIESAMVEVGSRYALFDNRETGRPDEMLRAAMWSWLCEHVGRAALLQESARNIKRAENTAEQNRVSLRAFHDADEAVAWLRAALEPSAP